MTKAEFANVIAYLEAGSGQALSKESATVYFDLLGDLDYQLFQIAAKMVIIAHPWHTFPSISELREAAAKLTTSNFLTASEAWAMAWRAIGRTDPEMEWAVAAYIDPLPPLVKRTILTYGLNSLCYGKEPIAIVRAQFIKIYDDLAEATQSRASWPLSLQRDIQQLTGTKSIGEHTCKQVNAVVAALPFIGTEPSTEK